MIDFEQIKRVNDGFIDELEKALRLAKDGEMSALSITVLREDNACYNFNAYMSGYRVTLLGSLELTKADLIALIKDDPAGECTCDVPNT